MHSFSGIPDRVDAVVSLNVRPVAGHEEAQLLSMLLQDEQPQSAVQLGGRQLRDMVGSAAGVRQTVIDSRFP